MTKQTLTDRHHPARGAGAREVADALVRLLQAADLDRMSEAGQVLEKAGLDGLRVLTRDAGLVLTVAGRSFELTVVAVGRQLTDAGEVTSSAAAQLLAAMGADASGPAYDHSDAADAVAAALNAKDDYRAKTWTGGGEVRVYVDVEGRKGYRAIGHVSFRRDGTAEVATNAYRSTMERLAEQVGAKVVS